MDSCDNCGREIGNLETSYVWQGGTVCAECSQRLQDTVSLALSAPPPEDPLDALAQSVQSRSARPTYIQNVYHQSSRPRVQTIELTGKKWKAHMAVSALVILLGFVALLAGIVLHFSDGMADVGTLVSILGALIILVGVIWHAFAKMGAWWHHG